MPRHHFNDHECPRFGGVDLDYYDVEPCTDDDCTRQHVHVFTDAEQRARDERIIVAAFHRVTGGNHVDNTRPADVFDAIIDSV